MATVEYGRNTDALELEHGGNEVPEQQTYGDEEPKPGFLLADAGGKPPEQMSPEEHKALAQKAMKLWTSQDEVMSRHLAQWKANVARRKGIANVMVQKTTDEARWKAVIPLGSTPDRLPATNHAADLCRKGTSQMFADPPVPEVEPPSGDDDDVESAQFSERVLLDTQGKHGLRGTATARRAYDRGNNFGSGFVFYYVDPKGGGRVPIEVEAGVDPATGDRATSVADAEEHDVPVMGDPDPMTGQAMPILDEMGQPMMKREPWPEFESRFVAPDGSLVDDKNQAATRWAPALKREILTGKNVRFLPYTCEDIWDADGMMVGTFLPFSRVRDTWPELIATLTPEQRKKLFDFKPERSEDILPAGVKDRDTDVEDDKLVFVLRIMIEAGSDYSEGCYFTALGNCYVAERREWVYEVEGGKRSLLVPLTQYRQWDEGCEHPYGVATMEILGPGNEIRAAQIGAWFDHLERFNNPYKFIPTTSTLLNKYNGALPRGTMIPVNPGGQPFFEDVPEFPRDAKELFATVSTEMDNAVALGPTARGLDTSDVKSGRHAYAVISQVHAGLSDLKENIENGYVRGCQIELQLIRAFFSVPQRLKWESEDGKFREKSWTGADLVDTTDIRIKAGTMTLLSPAAKAQLLKSFYLEDRILRPDEYRDAVTSAMGGYIVLEDDKHRLRVRRQIAAWKEGPEGGPVQGQPIAGVDPMTGLPTMELGPDPRAAEIWKPVPADYLPDVAAMRLTEIAKLMASTAYEKWPDAWRIAVDQVFTEMQMAAMPPAPVDPATGQPADADPLSAAQTADVKEKATAESVAMGA